MRALILVTLLIFISSLEVPGPEEVKSFVKSTINKKVRIRTINVWAIKQNYKHDLVPSVSTYLFEDLDLVENIAPEGNPNRPGDKHEKKYITVHDTGDFSFGAQTWSQAVHDAKIGKSIYNNSFQYVVGNDGYYHNIPDDETAYHAGDGRTIDSLFKEFPTGVKGDKLKPHVSISEDGYYTIEGEKTEVLAPTDSEGNILTEDYFNDLGIYTTIKDGMYYIGATWYSPTYNKIGNYGGNFNSIGIESCINTGSDIYFTWQRLAKLVAKLMDDNNFTIDQVVQHHYFSGKDCPQTMRTEGYWQHFLSLVKVEYQMLQYIKAGYKFALSPITTNYVNSKGRLIYNEKFESYVAYFTVKITAPTGEVYSPSFSTSVIPRN